MAGSFKHKFSRIVVEALRKRYHDGESLEDMSIAIKNETGLSISRQTLSLIMTDDEYIADPPKRNK